MACALGLDGRARAGVDGLLILPFVHPDGARDAVVGRVGHDGIAPDTWYHVVNGRLVPWVAS